VVEADLDEAGMAETVAGVVQAGRRGLAVKTDVSHLADVQALADRAFAELGAVHVVCNNAGVALWGGLESVSHQDWEWAMGVNLWGVIHGVEAFVPRMVAQKQPGHVVNTASMAGLIASQGLGVYNTTKYAVVGLSETLQKDLRGHDIGVSVLCPMGVNTRIRQSERNRPATLRNRRPRGHRGRADRPLPAARARGGAGAARDLRQPPLRHHPRGRSDPAQAPLRAHGPGHRGEQMKFSVIEGWGKLPEGFSYREVAGVAVDKQDRAFVFNR